jgi:hypothetical protein
MELRFRQIHLDFHTSELIAAVGAKFDPEAYAATLEKARVNSVTTFARCHHGWIYYDSKAHPERVHPQLLRRDLLKEQIAACRRRNIRVPIYTTVNWDHYTCTRHPEWRQILPDGRLPGTPPLEPGFYGRLCLNTPYVDFLKDHVADIFASLPAVDGFFFDIVGVAECVCRRCLEEMRSLKIDPARKEERLRFSKKVNDRFRHAMTAHVRAFSKDATVFYNQGHVGPAARESRDAFSHYELESLPSGTWGYAHFPIAIRYARTLGLDCLGMTGKFHTSWGDFHSFKNPAALEYECFQMLAQGAKCSVGDQLNPDGRLCPHTYELIGSVYSQVERKEAWCAGARAVVDAALLTPEEFTGEMMPPASIGAVRMLQAAAQQFDFIDFRADFAPYRLLILPDRIPVNDELSAKIDRYLAAGGKLIASFESGLNPEKTDFALKGLGLRLRPNPTRAADGTLARNLPIPGRGEYVEYLLPAGAIGKSLPPTELAMDMKGVEIEPLPGTETLAPTIASHFDRTWQHFCSHRQAPSSGRVDYPAVTRRGGVIYFAHPLFTLYYHRAPRWCRALLLNAIDLLLPDPLLRHDGPTTLTASVTDQPAHGRWVLHLLHYIPERRGQDFDVIEDVIPLHNVTVSLRVPRKVRAVRCVPEGRALSFHEKAARIEFTLPELRGHQMIEVNLA